MPKNMITLANCSSDVLTSTWDSADGALSYAVEAWGNKDDHNRYNCSSVDNSCFIRNVLCGESLTVHITASDDECPSYRTLGQVAETGEACSVLFAGCYSRLIMSVRKI